MIGKTLQNNNFKETTRYVLDKEKARLLSSSIFSKDSESIPREFLISRDLNPQIERPVYHLVDAYSYQDAATQNLSDDFMRDRAIEHFAGLVVSSREPELLRREDKTEFKAKVSEFIESELYEYQWFCATHEDTKHRHTHFVASRINLINGRCIATWADQERSHRICREIEKEHGLEQLKSYYEIDRRSLTRKQQEEWEQTGIAPTMVKMQNAIDQEAIPGRSVQTVQTALKEHHGIDSVLVQKKGKLGIVFQQQDEKGELVRMSGSQLGRGYILAAINRRLEQEIDIQAPQKTPEIEKPVEAELLQAVLAQQSEYANQLAPQIKEIWEREKAGRPMLKTATFEEYRIQVSEQNELELYRRDRKVMGYSSDTCQGYGLTEQDCAAMQRFNTLSQQQTQQWLEKNQKEAQQRKEKQKEAEKERQRECEKEYKKGMER